MIDLDIYLRRERQYNLHISRRIKVEADFRLPPRGIILVRQSLSALCTSSLEYVSTVSGSHSLSEAMLSFSLALFGLIRSKHLYNLLIVSKYYFLKLIRVRRCSPLAAMPHFRFYTMTKYIIYYSGGVCQEFFEFFSIKSR